MLFEVNENESEIAMLQKENDRLLNSSRSHQQVVQQLQQQLQQQQQQQQQQQTKGSKDTSSFQEVSKDQLRQELLNAAMTIEQMQEKISGLEEEKRKLEHSVQELFRQNQRLSDELQSKESAGGDQGNNNNDDSLNTSLADELGFDEPASSSSTPVSTPSKSIFSDMKVVPATPEKLFNDMDLKQRDDRQYREYVYMSLSAIKIAMAIKEAKQDFFFFAFLVFELFSSRLPPQRCC